MTKKIPKWKRDNARKKKNALEQNKEIARRASALVNELRKLADDIRADATKYASASVTDMQRAFVENAHHTMRRFASGEGRHGSRRR